MSGHQSQSEEEIDALARRVKGAQDWRAVGPELAHLEAQHQKLYETLDQLHTRGEGADEARRLEEVVRFIQDYAAFHFLNEERLMLEYGYDRERYWSHVREHKECAESFERLVKRFESGRDKAALAAEIADQLQRWLDHHIRAVDRQLVQFLREAGCK